MMLGLKKSNERQAITNYEFFQFKKITISIT